MALHCQRRTGQRRQVVNGGSLLTSGRLQRVTDRCDDRGPAPFSGRSKPEKKKNRSGSGACRSSRAPGSPPWRWGVRPGCCLARLLRRGYPGGYCTCGAGTDGVMLLAVRPPNGHGLAPRSRNSAQPQQQAFLDTAEQHSARPGPTTSPVTTELKPFCRFLSCHRHGGEQGVVEQSETHETQRPARE